MIKEKLICNLCSREVPILTEHHLVPKSRGGVETASICVDCHKQIHALFENKTLEKELNTIDALLTNENFQKYIEWVSKRPAGVIHKAKKSKNSRRRGRRG